MLQDFCYQRYFWTIYIYIIYYIYYIIYILCIYIYIILYIYHIYIYILYIYQPMIWFGGLVVCFFVQTTKSDHQFTIGRVALPHDSAQCVQKISEEPHYAKHWFADSLVDWLFDWWMMDLIWFDLIWFDLIWFGLVWFGLVWLIEWIINYKLMTHLRFN